VIIFGTGYSLESASLNVQGSSGNTIFEYYESKGGAQAYLGSCIPGFPNLFTLLGPNVATGHASVIFSQEAQISLALQLIRPVLEGKARSFEVTAEATDKYNEWLQKRLLTSVWTDCVSYYQTGANSKLTATFPGPVTLFWWFCQYPQWDKFRGVGSESWERERNAKRWTRLSIMFGLVVTLASLMNKA